MGPDENDHASTTRTVVNITGVAGQVAYAVTTESAHGDFTTTYLGSVYGAPGPIFMEWNGQQLHCDAPERFGERFDRAWIDAVIADADRFADRYNALDD